VDILAARKKAAERAREQKSKEQHAPEADADLTAPGPAPEPAAAPADQDIPASEPMVVPATASVIPVQAAGRPVEDQVAAPDSAAPAAVAEQQEQELEMLSFRLANEEYAVLVDDVKEVLKNRELTNIPNAPDHIMGVTSLRGPILPVLNLRKRLGLPPGGDRDERARILVLTLNDEDTGVVVDRVTGVVRIQPETIRPVPETIEHGAECLKGIARKDDRLYILLDIEKTLGV
jgi:purine-binding chemotaxis protein CheW